MVLLVGLTELKAQIRWLDSKTVRVYEWILPDRSTDFLEIGDVGDGEKVITLLQVLF